MRSILILTLYFNLLVGSLVDLMAEEVSSTYGAGLRFSLEHDSDHFSITIESPPGFNPSSEPQLFALQNPDRLVIDLPGMRVDSQRTLKFETDWTESIRVGKHEEKSRIVLDLKEAVLGQPTLSSTSSKKISISFQLAEHVSQEKVQTESKSDTALNQPAPVGWVERKAKEKPLVAKSPIKLPAKSISSRTPAPVVPEEQIANTTVNTIRAYTVKDNQLKVVEIENSKSVSKIPAREADERLLARLDSDSDVSTFTSQELSERDSSNQLLDTEVKSQAKPLQQSDKRIALKLSPGSPAQPLKEEFINYDHLPPPAKNPFVEESSWGWQLAFLFTLLCLIVVTLKRRSVVQNPALEVVPWFDDSELARREMYEVLGCKQDSSDTEVKERYRQLAKAFHSDKLSASDLPEELRALSEEQFKRIQNAYESIKKERGMH